MEAKVIRSAIVLALAGQSSLVGLAMTDLRTRLAKALQGHRDRHGMCSVEHDVDTLLALPRIAIVELPEVTQQDNIRAQWKWVQQWNDSRPDRKIITTWGSPTNGLMTADEARSFAAALLAAANKVDESK